MISKEKKTFLDRKTWNQKVINKNKADLTSEFSEVFRLIVR